MVTVIVSLLTLLIFRKLRECLCVNVAQRHGKRNSKIEFISPVEIAEYWLVQKMMMDYQSVGVVMLVQEKNETCLDVVAEDFSKNTIT
ncbi:MAG: hypothetical protein Q8O88_00805 [bacterium]|nr:hypothetical protein [bacterium]